MRAGGGQRVQGAWAVAATLAAVALCTSSTTTAPAPAPHFARPSRGEPGCYYFPGLSQWGTSASSRWEIDARRGRPQHHTLSNPASPVARSPPPSTTYALCALLVCPCRTRRRAPAAVPLALVLWCDHWGACRRAAMRDAPLTGGRLPGMPDRITSVAHPSCCQRRRLPAAPSRARRTRTPRSPRVWTPGPACRWAPRRRRRKPGARWPRSRAPSPARGSSSSTTMARPPAAGSQGPLPSNCGATRRPIRGHRWAL